MYSIELTRQAEKTFDLIMKSQPQLAKRLAHALDQLEINPSKGIRLRGELKGLYKYRVGDYRILYEIQKSKVKVIVIDIGHRREVYR